MRVVFGIISFALIAISVALLLFGDAPRREIGDPVMDGLIGRRDQSIPGGQSAHSDGPSEATESAVRVVALPLPEETPGRAGPRITFVASEDFQPLAHTEVLFFSPNDKFDLSAFGFSSKLSSAYDPNAFLSSGKNPDDWLREHGERLVADETGSVALPSFFSGAWISARHGERWGFLELKEGAAPPIVPLQEPLGVTVQVVDQHGMPLAGVPVGIETYHETSDVACGKMGFYNEWAGTTSAPFGTIEIPHRAWIEKIAPGQRDGRQDRQGTLWVSIGWLGSGGHVCLDSGRRYDEPIRMVMPPTGNLEFRVRGPDGRALARPVAAWFTFTNGASVPPSRGEDGVVVIPHILPGGKYRVRVECPGSGFSHAIVRATGPSRAGECAVFDVKLEPMPPLVRGLFLAPSGAPLAKRRIALYTAPPGHPPTLQGDERILTTDVGGVGVLLDDDPLGFWDNSSPGFALIPDEGELPISPAVWCEVGRRAWPRMSQPDIGTVQMHEAPLLVAGRVVDAAGRPVCSVQVTARRQRGPSQWVRPADRNRVIESVSSRTDSAGRFAIYHTEPFGCWAASAHVSRVSSSTRRFFEAGTNGIELTLTPWPQPVTLRGRLLLDPWIPAERIEVRAGFCEALISGAGEWFASIRPYPTPISARIRGASRPLVELPRVDVKGQPDDPVPVIDLRGRLTWIDLSVVDRNGQPARSTRWLVKSRGEPDPLEQGITDGLGYAGILVAHRDVDLYVGDVSGMVTHVPSASGLVRVAQQAGIPVRIEIEWEPGTDIFRRFMEVVIIPSSMELSTKQRSWLRHRVGIPEGQMELEVPLPGAYRIEVRDLMAELSQGATPEPLVS